MSPKKQRIAIAEVCGWADFVWSYSNLHEKLLGRRHPTFARTEVPDYLNDLNAVHEAEATIWNKPQWRTYMQNLYRLVPNGGDGLVHATAAQKREALLRTLNLWEEEES